MDLCVFFFALPRKRSFTHFMSFSAENKTKLTAQITTQRKSWLKQEQEQQTLLKEERNVVIPYQSDLVLSPVTCYVLIN